MSSKINLQTCEYACKSSIFQDNQLILIKRGETAKYTAAPLFLVNYSLSDKIICKLLKKVYTVIQ